jgi:hypothetical protein
MIAAGSRSHKKQNLLDDKVALSAMIRLTVYNTTVLYIARTDGPLIRSLTWANTGSPAVCPTGAAGLAGLIQLDASGAIDRGEAVGLCCTGFDRAQNG